MAVNVRDVALMRIQTGFVAIVDVFSPSKITWTLTQFKEVDKFPKKNFSSFHAVPPKWSQIFGEQLQKCVLFAEEFLKDSCKILRMSLLLTRDELKELTGRTRPKAQARVLMSMGIEHRVRPDGSILVLRVHLENLLCGMTDKRKIKNATPNWDAI